MMVFQLWEENRQQRRRKQIPFGDDSQKNRQRQVQRRKQIPFGDDNQKDDGHCKGVGMMFLWLAA